MNFSKKAQNKSNQIMRRMAERNITDDDLRGFIRDAKCVFMQWNGCRQLFAGDNGMCVVVQSGENWIYKTAWSKKDYDTESDKIMEVLRSVGL